MSSETLPDGDANVAPNVDVERSRNWNPGPLPVLSVISAWFVTALMATPQFVHEPPEKEALLLPPLVSVEDRLEPEITYTSVLFAAQTVWPVTEFEAQELTKLGVEMTADGMPLPSTWTRATPVADVNVDQAALAT